MVGSYRYPKITSKNYAKFVRTICPALASRSHKPSPLAALIHQLDLSHIVHEGRASYTARLLRRAAPSLEEFVAPQSSFGISCISALPRLLRLQHLDLSLVSQTVELRELFLRLRDLPLLTSLDFPRSTTFAHPTPDAPATEGERGEIEAVAVQTTVHWPQALRHISLAGSIPHVDRATHAIPPGLTDVHMSHFPTEVAEAVLSFVLQLGTQLRRLSISYRIPRLGRAALDSLLFFAPNVDELLVAVDYISPKFFSRLHIAPAHPLRRLILDSTGDLRTDEKIEPNDVWTAVDEGLLSNLRVVRVSSRLNWLTKYNKDVLELQELLETLAEEAGENSAEAGVWEFNSERMNAGGFGGYS